MSSPQQLLEKYRKHDATVGIVGLGYVGLPLALAFAERGFLAIGFDVDPNKVSALGKGRCYIQHIGDARVAAAVSAKKFVATADFERLRECDAIMICVPTPLT